MVSHATTLLQFRFNLMRKPRASELLLWAVADYQRHRDSGKTFSRSLRRLAWLRYRLFSVITGTDIHLGAKLGKGLRIPHPNGVVFHRCTVIGDDCLIMQQVTLGQLEIDDEAPIIGNDVYIGAGAKVLGRVRIGNGAKIGANAVVLKDVPAKCTAVGIPAHIVGYRRGRQRPFVAHR